MRWRTLTLCAHDENSQECHKRRPTTYSLASFTRDQARKIIEDLGGRVSSSVSKKTDFVVVGADPGSKYDKALQLKVKTLDEEEFKKLIGKT